MELQVNKVKGKQVNRTVDNVVISEGSLTYCVKNNEYGVDLSNIDFAVVTDSPVTDLAIENERLRAALASLVAWYDTCDDSEQDDYMRFDSDNDDGELDAIVDAARAAIAKAEGGE